MGGTRQWLESAEKEKVQADTRRWGLTGGRSSESGGIAASKKKKKGYAGGRVEVGILTPRKIASYGSGAKEASRRCKEDRKSAWVEGRESTSRQKRVRSRKGNVQSWGTLSESCRWSKKDF